MTEFKRLINDDVFNIMPKLKDHSFHTIFCDSPYNLSSNWIIDTDGSFQIEGSSKDFMSKWDSLGGKELDVFFKESNRVLKHGGFCIMFGLDNQIAPFQYYAVKNGFEVCQSLYYYYMNNMPKSTDVSKSIDRVLGFTDQRQQIGVSNNSYDGATRDPNKHKTPQETSQIGDWGLSKTPHGLPITKGVSELAQQFDGYKYGKKPLKQVVEVIMVYRKKNKYGSVLNDLMQLDNDNTLSPPVLDIENNRVGYTSNKDKEGARFGSQTDIRGNNYGTNKPSEGNVFAKNVLSSEQGRYPSNVFISNEASEKLDAQSGTLKSGKDKNPTQEPVSGFFGGTDNYYSKEANYGDSGGASRILHKCSYEEDDNIDLFIYGSKVSPTERNAGLDNFESIEGHRTTGKGFGNPSVKCPEHNESIPSGSSVYKCGCKFSFNRPDYVPKSVKNTHPTLKNIAMLTKLIKLFKLPSESNQKILIPFSGAGSEILSCLKAKIPPENITAIEISEEYCKIAKQRIDYWTDKWNKENS